jgi:hypothetical protein
MNAKFKEAEHQQRMNFAEYGDKEAFKDKYRNS